MELRWLWPQPTLIRQNMRGRRTIRRPMRRVPGQPRSLDTVDAALPICGEDFPCLQDRDLIPIGERQTAPLEVTAAT